MLAFPPISITSDRLLMRFTDYWILDDIALFYFLWCLQNSVYPGLQHSLSSCDILFSDRCRPITSHHLKAVQVALSDFIYPC